MIEQRNRDLERLEDNHKNTIASKEDEIASLRKKINDMSSEFSMMLKVF